MTQKVEKNPSGSGLSNVAAAVTVVICILVGFAIWRFVLGDPSHFANGDRDGDPLPGDLLGMMYKGGPVIGILIGLLKTTIVFGFKRLIVIKKVTEKDNKKVFVTKFKFLENTNQVNEVIKECNKKKGSFEIFINSVL